MNYMVKVVTNNKWRDVVTYQDHKDAGGRWDDIPEPSTLGITYKKEFYGFDMFLPVSEGGTLDKKGFIYAYPLSATSGVAVKLSRDNSEAIVAYFY